MKKTPSLKKKLIADLKSRGYHLASWNTTIPTYVHENNSIYPRNELKDAIILCAMECGNPTIIMVYDYWVFYKEALEDPFYVLVYRDIVDCQTIEECEELIKSELG